MLNILFAFMMFLQPQTTIYSISVKDINGKLIDFSKFKGKKILIVNTASECGYTPQYADLQKLYEQYGSKLVVIGFPANNFGGQEPGSNAEIKSFCSSNYNVTFPMAAKVSVKGDDICPLFKWLIEQENPEFKGDVSWNFEKFLIDENGKLIHRYKSKTKPLDKAITDVL